MEEVWKDYIYNYQVSNYGRVKNKLTNKILNIATTKKRYCQTTVSLGSRNNYKIIRIHRAVAELFIPNPNNLPQVNHIDGDKTNNKVDNLEWCDNSHNVRHAYSQGLMIPTRGDLHGMAKLTAEEVNQIKKEYKPYSHDANMAKLAQKYNVSVGAISNIVTGKSW